MKKQEWYTDVFKPVDITQHYSLQDYWMAPSGQGELAYQWEDKPHRLVYDLIAYAMFLQEQLDKQ